MTRNRRWVYGPGGDLERIVTIESPRSIPDPLPPIGVRTRVRALIVRWRRRG